jgi:hypothetical protein
VCWRSENGMLRAVLLRTALRNPVLVLYVRA